MGDTIVMIHGMWSAGWAWDNYGRFFTERGYDCHIPTLRFHDVDLGEPPHPELGTTSLLDYAADLENEISKLNGRPIIIGHSMGGLLALILGSRGLARALVLLTLAPPRGVLALKLSAVRGFWSCLTTWRF